MSQPRRFRALQALAPLALILGALALAACGSRPGLVEKDVIGGDVEAGARAIERYGCGTCHTIPGIPGANARVGPPLEDFQYRHYIAGQIPNTADNLILWIMNPQAIEPGTLMPYLGVTPTDARNIVAYLYRD